MTPEDGSADAPADPPPGSSGLPPASRAGHARGVDLGRIERAVREILIAIGEDPDRDGLRGTPGRVARACAEQFSGMRQHPEEVLGTVFDADHDEMVLVRDIEVYGT